MQEKGLKALTSMVNLGSATSRAKFRFMAKAYKQRATRHFFCSPIRTPGDALREEHLKEHVEIHEPSYISFYTYACGNFVWASFVM